MLQKLQNGKTAETIKESSSDFKPKEENRCKTANMLLIQAISSNNAKETEEALKNGANPNFTHGTISALIFAAYKNAGESAKALINGNADVNKKVNGITPLITAVSLYGKDNFEIVKVLLEKKAKVNETDEGGMTALMYAIRNRANNCAKLLLKSPEIIIDAKDQDGRTVFHHAIDVANTEMIKILSETYPEQMTKAQFQKNY